MHRRPLVHLRRTADVVFPKARVAVFVDGCFWHGCPDHGRREHRTNGWYWPDKIRRNVERDRDTDQKLSAQGWQVIRVWEHENYCQAAIRIEHAVRAAETRGNLRPTDSPVEPRNRISRVFPSPLDSCT